MESIIRYPIEGIITNRSNGVSKSQTKEKQSENGKNDDTIVSESGQVNIQVMVTRSISENTGFVTNVIKNHLQEWGCLFAFNKVKSFADGSFQAVAEFCEKTAAATALAKGQKVKLEEVNAAMRSRKTWTT